MTKLFNYVAALGQLTTESHNEVRMMAGTLGASTLVCLMNNGPNAATESSANLLGPFWRTDSPRTENGGSLLRSSTPGPALFFKGWVRDEEGQPIAGAEVDVWHASPVGLYENQDPDQAEMNLRGKFTTDANGEFSFRSIKPAGYPIPIERSRGRSPERPEAPQLSAGAPPLSGVQAGVQDCHVTDLFAGRSSPRNRLAIRRDPRTGCAL